MKGAPVIKKIYSAFCRVELWIAAALLLGITVLVFISAIARTALYPMNWAVDMSLLLFAWLVFLGGDIVVRSSNLIGVDIFLKMLPQSVQQRMQIGFYLLMIAFLAVLVVYGIPLCLDNRKRLFQALNLSYSWCSLSVPVGSLLMIISSGIRLNALVQGRDATDGVKRGEL